MACRWRHSLGSRDSTLGPLWRRFRDTVKEMLGGTFSRRRGIFATRFRRTASDWPSCQSACSPPTCRRPLAADLDPFCPFARFRSLKRRLKRGCAVQAPLLSGLDDITSERPSQGGWSHGGRGRGGAFATWKRFEPVTNPKKKVPKWSHVTRAEPPVTGAMTSQV